MTDDFLLEAQANWRRQDAGFVDVQAHLRRTRLIPIAILVLELLGAAIGLAVGVWFAWVAAVSGELIFALSAIVMIGAMPPVAVATVLARRNSLRWEDETPDSVLRVGLRRAEATLAAIRISRWGVVVIVAFNAVLWAFQLAGLLDALDFLTLYSSASAATCIAGLLWLSWRQKRVVREHAACQRLLNDLQAAERNP
jgi:hypothetical protein